LPPLILAGFAVVALAGIATAFSPPGSSYLFSRFTLSTELQQSLGYAVRSTGNLSSLGKYELALFVLPVIVVLAGASSRAFVQRAAVAWILGILVSIAAAYTDYLHLTHFSVSLIGYNPISNRQPGLSAQANNIGVQAAMSAPLLLTVFLRASIRARCFAVVAVAGSALGIYISGSRGSAVGILLGVLVTLVVVRQTRIWTARIMVGVVVGGIYLFLTTGGSRILDVLRLSNNQSATQSDAGRSMLRAQGIKDFYHSPLHGIGWGFSNQAHLIYIQLLAAGGVVGFAGVALVVLGVLGPGWRIRSDPLAGALIAATVTWLLIGLVENQLTDQWIYVPLALLAALIGQERLNMLARRKAAPMKPGNVRPQDSKRNSASVGRAQPVVLAKPARL